MKKITKSLLIALPLFAMMAVTTSCGSDSSDDVAITRPGKANEAMHSITVAANDAVTVNVASSATSGTRVDVNLAYDAEVYKVTDVLVNDDLAVKNSDTNYSFTMPSADVELTVKTEFVDPTYGKHTITNVESDKGVNLLGLPTFAEAGDELTFKVQFAWDSAYSFNNKIEVYTLDAEGEKDEDVILSSLANEYSFTMPDSDIAVKVGTVEKRFSFTRDTDTTSNISKVETAAPGATLKSIGNSDAILTFGTQVKVTLKDTDATRALGVVLHTNAGDITLDADEDKAIEFTMPASDVVMTVLGEINYKTITITENEVLSIEIVEPVTVEEETTYEPVADLDHFVPGDSVYVRVTSTNDNFIVNDVKVTRSGSTSITTTAVYGETNLWRFTMQNYDDVTVSATAKELKFKNYEFLGKYFGNNLYGENKRTTATTSTGYTVTIDATGSLVKGSATKTIASATATSGDGHGVFTDSYEFEYGNEFVFGHYSFTKKLEDAYNKDYIVAVKALDPNDTYGMYSFRYFIPSGKAFIAVEALRTVGDDTTVCGMMFFDAERKEFFDTGVTFEFISGGTVIDADAVFNLKVMDRVVGTIDAAAGTYTKNA